jgi:dTDP-glucose 4,6-dehydratase
MNLLVTGGCGFIGSNFVRRQRQRHPGDRVVVLDALTYAGNPANLADLRDDPGLVLVRGDICDAALAQRVLAEHAIDAVAHFAAESHVDRSITGPGAFVQTNIVGTFTLLEAARAAKVGRFLHISTDEVYGDLGPEDPAFTETTPLAPRSPYAASKAASDHLVLSYAHTYRFPALISRCSNNYGPYQFPEKLIPLMILSALSDQPLPVYGDGTNVRDWIHVDDHCDGLDLILRRGQVGQVYNLGGRCERRNIDIVHEILALLGKPASLIRFVTDRPGHDRRYAMNISRAEAELGYAPRYDLATGLAQTVAWYKENRPWWEAIRSGEYRTWYERNYGARLQAEARA